MGNILAKLFGKKSDRDINEINPILKDIQVAYETIKNLSNDGLRAKTAEFRESIINSILEEENQLRELRQSLDLQYDMEISEKERIWKEIDELEKIVYGKIQDKLSEILPDAFAVMKETAKRFKENEYIEVTASEYDKELAAKKDNVTIHGNKARFSKEWLAGGNTIRWDMVHYDVQLIGGIILHQGKIAEMATGEGKTLVATLPVYLNALPGKGVHIVTVNDYLAKRDSEWMGVLYEFHGLRVDCIDRHQPNSNARRNAYLADITFGTNSEFGFDYLRDNMTQFPDELVQRVHNYAIVDEVDSVLIDDARTPLIISGPTVKDEKQEFDEFKGIVQKIYNVQRNYVTQLLAEAKKLLAGNPDSEKESSAGELLLKCHKGLPKNTALIKFLSEEGMKLLLQKTENRFLQDNAKNMHLITDDLYFMIEEKNSSVDFSEKGINFINDAAGDPDFYSLPDVGSHIADLDRLEISENEKLEKKNQILTEFSIKSERVHIINQLLKAYTLFEKDVEYVIIDNKIKIVDEQTGRIMEGRRYSDGLHQAIEAKENVTVEGATQTYATITLQNYFRMYKKLAGMTGTAETEAGELWNIYKLDVVVIPTNRPVVRKDMEDLIYRTKREKYNAVINEIENLVKKQRPVLVGTTSVETSELLSRMLLRKNIKHNVLNAKLHQREADIVAEAGKPGTVTIATNMAGRGTDIKLGPGVKEAGGLAIIGTERHESRRVDRQLRGRSGRQGDPGSSQFFVSLEDDLMRMFGSERIAKIMDRLGLKEGEVIQHSLITKSIERAQRKVEENNFGIRKRLLEYDDVMNVQREAIYKKRKNALFGDRLALDISNMFDDTIDQIVNDFQEQRDFEGLRMELLKSFIVEPPFDEKSFMAGNKEDLAMKLEENILTFYKNKNDFIRLRVLPIVKDLLEKNTTFENIAVPVTDGKKEVNIIANIKKSYENQGKEVILAIEKSITLSHIDSAWKEHLREMDELKHAVQTATYEQKDPLLIYKFESFELFKSMVQRTNKEITSYLVKSHLPGQQPNVQQATQQVRRMDTSRFKEERTDLLSQAYSNTQHQEKTQPVKADKKVGRNDPCPCGSGKKYKQCHGRNL